MNLSVRRPVRLSKIVYCFLAAGTFFAVTEATIPTPAAWAHARLLVTSPKSDTVVTQPLREVTLIFNEKLQEKFTTIRVTGPDGRSFTNGPVSVAGTAVTQPVQALPATTIRVAWRTVSEDGHPVEGSFTFTVAPEAVDLEGGETPEMPEASPPPAVIDDAQPVPSDTEQSASRPTRMWPWLLVSAGVLLALAAATVFWRRSPANKG